MNVEYLIEKLKKVAGLSSVESDAAFQYLLKSVYKKLNTNQVLKIPQLGFFQLKSEPMARAERKGKFDKSYSKHFLVFVPIIENEDNLNKVFINIDIDTMIDSDIENADKAFSLGFNQPIIPPISSNANSFAKKIKNFAVADNFEEKVDEILAKAEVIDDFNIFTDYLPSSLQADNSMEDVGETVKEIFNTENDENIIENNLANESDNENSINANEEFSELLDKNFTEEDIEKLFSNEELGKIPLPEKENQIENESLKSSEENDKETSVSNEVNLEVEEESHEEILNLSSTKVEFETEEEKKDNPDKKKTMFDELEEVLASKSETYEILDEVESEKSEDAVSPTDESNKTNIKTNEPKPNPFYKSVIFWFSVIFVVILLAIFSWWNRDYFLSNKSAVVKKSNSQVNIQPPQVSTKAEEEKIDSVEPQINQNALPQKDEINSSLYRIPNKDIKINNQVFFDGSKYSVQISSWLNSSVAENEVRKLRARGFDAFVYKASVNGNMWHRVRIGYFKSADEANNFLVNNQLKEIK